MNDTLCSLPLPRTAPWLAGLVAPLFATLLASASFTAAAHVSLRQPFAQAGQPHEAVFLVGHGCGGDATTRIAVQVPADFKSAKPAPRPGWNAEVKDSTVTWTAVAGDAALPSRRLGEFVLAGTAPAKAGPLWFKVAQSCGTVTQDWSQVPAKGTSIAGLKTPAALLQVMAEREFDAKMQQPLAEGAWARASVAGQRATGAFMRLKAREAVQLVGAESPVAGVTDVHEMKMEGNVMRMRAVSKLDIKAGESLDLVPGGYHVMLQDLKQPLAVGTTVPLTLTFRNARGVESRLDLTLPVAAQAPGAAPATATPGVRAAPPADGHKH